MAALARFYEAMAEHREGRVGEAKVGLEQANDLLARLLKGGDLDLPHPSDGWGTLAAALVARDAAEVLIYGKRVSEPVTNESLAAARAAWKPVHDLLVAMDEAARAQDYAAARQLYNQARTHPAFDLETADQDFPWLFERVAATLIHADAREDYLSFLEEICRENTTLPNGNYLFAGLISPWELPAELQSRIREAAVALEQAQTKSNAAEGKGEDYFDRHHLGVAFYRLGRYKEGLEHLQVGMEAPIHAVMLSSTAYAALVAWKLGRAEEARAYQKQAEEGLAMRLEASNEQLDPKWLYLSLTDLALKEGREMMRKAPAGRSSSLPDGRPRKAR